MRRSEGIRQVLERNDAGKEFLKALCINNGFEAIMLPTASLHRYPYVRLLVPWIAGIFCGDRFFDRPTGLSLPVFLFALFAVLSVGCHFLKRHTLRWCFGLSVTMLCFAGGWIAITLSLRQSVYAFPEGETAYHLSLSDKPERKAKSFLCRVDVRSYRDSLSVRPVSRRAIVYFQADSAAAALREGDELLVFARISPPANRNNFDEFDYARFLLRKGTAGTGYAASGKWTKLPVRRPLGWHGLAGNYRGQLLDVYRSLGFDGDELAVLSALTVGDKRELSEDIRESYSVAGVSHVLALSGLHIGLLTGLLLFILKPLTRRSPTGRVAGAVLLTAVLWLFAFVTGFAPSVVRSVCMFSIWISGSLLARKSLSVNTLAATAFAMLLYRPSWLFDVGFQLSFLAVASILLLHPVIYPLISLKGRTGTYIGGLMSVSVAAQVGTAPLVWVYFSRFPVHFLLTNLVVLPLVTTILYAAVLMLALTPFPAVQAVAALPVRLLLKTLNGFVQWAEQLPYASVDHIRFSPAEALIAYLFLMFLLCFAHMRRARYLQACLFCLLSLAAFRAITDWRHRPQRSIVFYNLPNCPVVHCVEGDGRSWLSYADSLPDTESLRRTAGRFWQRSRLNEPKHVIADHREGNFFIRQRLLTFYDCRVCIVADNRWRGKTALGPLPVRYLYLCRGYGGRLQELIPLFAPSCVVMDASLSDRRRRLFEKECEQLGIRFISLPDKGSVRFLL